MAHCISLALLLWIVVPGTKSDTKRLLEILSSTEWPWFGDSYKIDCPESSSNWPLCFNPRPDESESTLQRVGIPANVQLSVELEVVFSAPFQLVAVCGKVSTYPEVDQFHLNPNGIIDPNLLMKGAEIYRKFPSITWPPEEDEISDLMLIDAGYIQVNGYALNIQKSHQTGSLVGEALWSYLPPANPAHHTNPNLIVLMGKSPKVTMTPYTLLKSGCVTNGVSVSRADSCRKYLIKYFSEVTIRGLQVYYTDGSSLYEQYRACTKSLFCNETCIDYFKSYVESMKTSISFTTINSDDLDMYVNLNFFSPSLLKYTACCSERQLHSPYSFRAVPGDDLLVAPYQVNKHNDSFMRLELAGSAAMAADTKTLYSVLMVDSYEPDFASSEKLQKVHGHLWIANLIYQELQNTPNAEMLISYTGPTPLEGTTHRYFIMLYSHTKATYSAPDNFFGYGYPGNEGWDLTKLPSDFRLRAMTWFRCSSDEYTISKLLHQSGLYDSCRLVIPSYSRTCPMQFKDLSHSKRPSVDLTKKHSGFGVESSANTGPYAQNGGASLHLPSTHFGCPSTNPLVGVTLVSMFIYMAMAGV